ncbi:hypothetical protein WICPIJ_000637 [Wickerhamomyces pijperi]|uniref:Uncharacterized protein n=1 Tax=Wickerhamomyces pijperi TaxID=599730 RepID=A0A9P8QFM7_WICPI|nr:hypothetical protein WICPIJ_000637 [Wickerhamomyces pijperi]
MSTSLNTCLIGEVALYHFSKIKPLFAFLSSLAVVPDVEAAAFFLILYGTKFFNVSLLSLVTAETTVITSPFPFNFKKPSFSMTFKYLAAFFQDVFFIWIDGWLASGKLSLMWFMNSDAGSGNFNGEEG